MALTLQLQQGTSSTATSSVATSCASATGAFQSTITAASGDSTTAGTSSTANSCALSIC
ncbi:MAG: hypothetical protein IPI60_20950 [Saprospiraceae bacterium]|nr:hypothetical protein [Saprospiraceae bacterium]